MYEPDEALVAGFLDRVVEPELIRPTLEAMIAMLRSIHKPSHATAKQRLRQGTMEAMRAAIERELTLSAYEAGNRTRATVVMPRS